MTPPALTPTNLPPGCNSSCQAPQQPSAAMLASVRCRAILTMGIHETLLNRARTSLTRISLHHRLGALLQSSHHSTVLSAQGTLAPRCLTLEKCYRSWILDDPCFPHYLHRRVIDPATGATGAAFVSGQTTKQWRLTDGASCLQAELVAIRGALHHALESHSPHVIITHRLKILYPGPQRHTR
ncbi:hypothetical protein GWK47_007570 [Chionoecetes opilio]|uniref:RNase H type-1 domain-containing protein n=1 Tax=Chionoecetes opilio TaxID=41210 RepID=A0A8J4Y1W2_CHIOP|nr:hypothetical protein GWK47_007570 [Chionoecetes opilio]